MKINRIEMENRDLKDKIEVTNEGISSYIAEMSTMLDSQELGQNFNGRGTGGQGLRNSNADGLVNVQAQDTDNMGPLAIDPLSLENEDHVNFEEPSNAPA